MRNKKQIFTARKIVSVDDNDSIFTDSAIVVLNDTISEIIPKKNISNYTDHCIVDYGEKIIIPGFIQTHVHLCQVLFRALAEDLELLNWLRNKIFKFENLHTSQSLKASAAIGISELQISGTTTILDMGTINHQEKIFDEMIHSGLRGFSGKCMMDRNELLPEFKESTSQSLESCNQLAHEFHGYDNGRIKYAFAPRFVLSCSERLLRETSVMLDDFKGSLFHTHASENKNEVAEVRKLFKMENIEYLKSLDVLDYRTVLAHCIHLCDREKEILTENQVSVSHCPSTNLKLGSGIANIPDMMKRGINISLGSDGAPCNNSLNIFNEMKLAGLIQKPIHGPRAMKAKDIFKMATINGAKTINLEREVGSIEIGKKADLVILDLNKIGQPCLVTDENIFSSIVYSATQENILDVFIGGKKVIENRKSLVYDEEKIFNESKKELNKLLKKI